MIEINKTYNENCLITMNNILNNFIDLIITSPPYDEMRTYNKSTENFNNYSFNFENIARELFRVIKQGGVMVWVVNDSSKNGNESGNSFRQALYFKEIGFNLFDTMIYSKPCRGAVGSNKGYWQSFEYMFVFSKGTPKTINLIKDRENKESRKGDNGTKRLKNGELINTKRKGYDEMGRRTNIWEYNIGKNHSTKDVIAFEHPAIMPEKLVEDHIISWSNENDLVYDPFMGSGTVAKMSILNKRNYIGSEINKDYCDIIEKRLKSIY